MYSRQVYDNNFIIFDGATSDGYGNTINVEQYRHIVLALHTTGTATLTLKFMGSISQDAPDFSASVTSDNHYEYLRATDMDTGSNITGNTGISLSSTDTTRLLELDTNLIRYITAEISGYSSGTLYLFGKASTD